MLGMPLQSTPIQSHPVQILLPCNAVQTIRCVSLLPATGGSLRTPLSTDRRQAAAPGTPVATPVRRSRGSAGDPLASLLADQAVTVKVGVRVRPMTDR